MSYFIGELENKTDAEESYQKPCTIFRINHG